MFHEMALKLYFMKCPERNVSQCNLALTAASEFLKQLQKMASVLNNFRLLTGYENLSKFQSKFIALCFIMKRLIYVTENVQSKFGNL